MSMCPKTSRVIAPKGWKNVYLMTPGNEKETVTVLLIFTASGEIIPPLVVFPYVRPPKYLIESMPKEWFLGKTETGWMRSETFFEYVANGVHPWIEEKAIKKPVLLLVDGHKSHLTLEVSEFCSNNEIILYALPPNATHILQPADVSVFRPLKNEWQKTVRDWQTRQADPNVLLTKSHFCPLLKEVLEKCSLTDAIKNGFRKCGLYPFNIEAVDFTKCVNDHIEKLNIENQAGSELPQEAYVYAEKVVDFISPKLESLGIDVNLIKNIIREANSQSRQEENNLEYPRNELVVSTLENLPVGVYNLDEDGNLAGPFESDMQMFGEAQLLSSLPSTRSPQKAIESESNVQERHKNDSELPDIGIFPFLWYRPMSPKDSDSNKIQTLETETQYNKDKLSTSTPSEKVNLCLPSTSSLQETPSPITSHGSEHRKKELLPIAPSSPGFIRPSTSTCVISSCSPSLKKHFYYPKPLTKVTNRKRIGQATPSAISSAAWREIILKKEIEKAKNQETIKIRKEEKIKRKEIESQKKTRINKIKASQKAKVKITCASCQEELVSDVEDDNLKNVGCDVCPNWFHLKCTHFTGIPYQDVASKDFTCNSCTNNNIF